MTKRLTVGVDGNAIYVGLGSLPEPESKFHFVEIDFSKEAKSRRAQAADAVLQWYTRFPEEGLLPFDIEDGL